MNHAVPATPTTATPEASPTTIGRLLPPPLDFFDARGVLDDATLPLGTAATLRGADCTPGGDVEAVVGRGTVADGAEVEAMGILFAADYRPAPAADNSVSPYNHFPPRLKTILFPGVEIVS